MGMSERLSQREFASKVATAFDCHDYVKRKKVCSTEGRSHSNNEQLCLFLIDRGREEKGQEAKIKMEVC